MSGNSRRHLRLVLHGKAAARPEIREAVAAVRADGHRVEVRVTWEAGDSALFAKEAAAQGVEVVVAGGGDGSLNEVVSGVVDGSGPPKCSIALLPLGTANDFAHGCGIPVDDPTAALRLAAETEARPIDLCQINGRVFVNMATGGDVLHDLNVHIPAGRRVAVVGETGSGKSTFVKLAKARRTGSPS